MSPPSSMPHAHPSPAGHGAHDGNDLRLTLGFVAAALILRLLSFVYSVYNYDESLYILMGAEMSRGHLPFTTVCDLKPFGLFSIFGLFTALPFDGVMVARLAACLVVGLTADLIRRVAGHLFDDADHTIGIVAGLAFIVFTLANGGVAAQGELFHDACAVLALFILLRAMRRGALPSWKAFMASGLVLGVGIQIKQSVVFDMAAIMAGTVLLTMPGRWPTLAYIRSILPGMALLVAASLVPTLGVVGIYWLTGHLDAWVAANITAHQVFYGLSRPFEIDPALRAMWEQAPLWFSAILAALLLGRLTYGDAERRAGLFLLVWVAAIMACIVFLRIASDHYFLQFLPSLSLLTGLLVGRAVLANVLASGTRTGIIGALTCLAFFAIAKEPLIHTGYILWDRVVHGERFAGDTPRRIAADIKPELRPDDSLYVVGFQPLVYYVTGAKLATRFAFTGLPHRDYPGRDGCPWVEQKVEMQRVLDSRPRFIVVEDGIFFHQLDPAVKSILVERLASDYRLRRRYEQHHLHHLYPFERFVMNGGAPAEVYELARDSRLSSAQ
ncbi:ArnT family glycosyltransferase [Microvirga aerilata]